MNTMNTRIAALIMVGLVMVGTAYRVRLASEVWLQTEELAVSTDRVLARVDRWRAKADALQSEVERLDARINWYIMERSGIRELNRLDRLMAARGE